MNNTMDRARIEKDCLVCIFLSAVSFSIYYFTLAPTALWGDSAAHILYTYNIRLTIAHGFYPFHTIMGWAFRSLMPSNVAFSQNLLSAVMASFVIPVIYLTVFAITNSRFSAVAAAISLSVSHTFWLLSVINESYSLNLLLFSLLLLLLILWIKSERPSFLYGFAFIYGLSFFAGYMALLLIPAGIIIFLKSKRSVFKGCRVRVVIFCFLSGLLPWLVCLAADIAGHNSLKEFMGWLKDHAVYRQFWQFITPRQFLIEVLKYPFYLFYQFPIAGFLLGLGAIMKSGRYSIANTALALFTLFMTIIIYTSCFFYQRHFYVYVYSYLVFAVFIGIGLEIATGDKRLRYKAIILSLMIVFPILSYAAVPRIMPEDNPFFRARDIPYRDNIKYFLQPGKRGYSGAREYARNAFTRAGEGDIIISDYTILTVLRYFKEVEKSGGDGVGLILDESIDIPEYITGKIGRGIRIYLADNEDFYRIKELKKEYDIVPRGVLYEVRKR